MSSTHMANTLKESEPSEPNKPLPELAIYIHWPYCLARCPYCDFNTSVANHQEVESRYINSLITEIKHNRIKLGNRKIASIFFGGGTPSLMRATSVNMVIDAISDVFHLELGTEITLEANPTSSSLDHFVDLKNAGVNRLSLGVQALNDDDLQFLGRKHTASEAKESIDNAHKVFDRFSFDMIYARHHEHGLQNWENELSAALDFAGDHISAYALTIEPKTPFATWVKNGTVKMPTEMTQGKFIESTREICDKKGFNQYEISNFSTSSGKCEHNLVYWRYGEFLGVGAGAHSRILVDNTRVARSNHRSANTWMNSVESNVFDAGETENLSCEQQAIEILLNGMRLNEGVRLSTMVEICRLSPADQKLEHLKNEQLIWHKNGCIGINPNQMLLTDNIISQLIEALE